MLYCPPTRGWRATSEQTAKERFLSTAATQDDVLGAETKLNWLMESNISTLATSPEFAPLFAGALGAVSQLQVVLNVEAPAIPSGVKFISGERSIGTAKPKVRFDRNGGLYVQFDFADADGVPGIYSVAGMSTQDEDSVPLLTPYFLHLIIEALTP